MLHCVVSYVHGNQQSLYITKRVLEAILNKKIIPNNWSMYVHTPQKRLDKLIKRGWSIDQEEVDRIHRQSSPVFSQNPVRSRSLKQILSTPAPTLPKSNDEMIEKALDLLLGDVDKNKSEFTTPWDIQTK